VATYATTADVRAAATSPRAARKLPDDDGIEALLERGERAVDLLVGPWPRLDADGGLKLGPSAVLTDVQRDAVKRATCSWVLWAVTVGDEFIVGGPDYAPTLLAVVQRAAAESPEMARALADHGLVKRTLTAGPDPEPVTVACPPDGGWWWSCLA
jgi:hypothetical protein